jgi:hypothetical protein
VHVTVGRLILLLVSLISRSYNYVSLNLQFNRVSSIVRVQSVEVVISNVNLYHVLKVTLGRRTYSNIDTK